MKITGILVLGIVVVLCFGLLWTYNSQGKNVSEPQDQGQGLVNALNTANHQIDWATATRLITNHKASNLSNNSRVSKGNRGGTFARSAIDKLLAQPGVIGIRYYYARNDDGSPTLVLVGVDARGQDMLMSALEGPAACPPFCD